MNGGEAGIAARMPGKGKEVAASADADGDYGDAVNIRRIDFVFWTFQL